MKDFKTLILSALFATLNISIANAVILDFDEIFVGGPFGLENAPGRFSSPVSFDDATFTSPSLSGTIFTLFNDPEVCVGGCVDNGSQYLTFVKAVNTNFIQASLIFSSPFTLNSFEFASGFLTQQEEFSLTITGIKIDGSEVTQTFTSDPLSHQFQLAVLNNEFSDLTTVAFFSDFSFVGDQVGLLAVDNFSITPVPIPASLLFFVTGVACISWRRRKSKLT